MYNSFLFNVLSLWLFFGFELFVFYHALQDTCACLKANFKFDAPSAVSLSSLVAFNFLNECNFVGEKDEFCLTWTRSKYTYTFLKRKTPTWSQITSEKLSRKSFWNGYYVKNVYDSSKLLSNVNCFACESILVRNPNCHIYLGYWRIMWKMFSSTEIGCNIIGSRAYTFEQKSGFEYTF